MRRPFGLAPTPLSIELGPLVDGALRYSSYVHVVAAEPKIRRAAVTAEQARFDWRTFLNTTYNNVNEPVGNVLTTGTNEDRFKDRTWSLESGFRRQNVVGGELELAQRVGDQRNNSRFLLPNPQGTSRLELQYTQPLLNGFGMPYNESQIMLAQISTNVSEDELVEKLQDHLMKVTEAYWELYRARAEFFQRQKVLAGASTVLRLLEGRQEVDAAHRQVLRARAAVATRQSQIVGARTAVRNAESRIRLLVNDPSLLNSACSEFTPSETPFAGRVPLAVGDLLYEALVNRPDISRSIREIRAAAVRLGASQNQILPRLDAVVSTYVAGLAADADIASAFGKQFSEGRPSYSAGFEFEMPLGNRLAWANQDRRQWEMARAMAEFRLCVEQSLTDVEVAARVVETKHQEILSRYQAMIAAENEASYLLNRWQSVPGLDDSSTLLLENLLDAQNRLVEEEVAMTNSQVEYAMALVRLRRETGTLLRLHSPDGHMEGDLLRGDNVPVPISLVPDPTVLPSPSSRSVERLPAPLEPGNDSYASP